MVELVSDDGRILWKPWQLAQFAATVEPYCAARPCCRKTFSRGRRADCISCSTVRTHVACRGWWRRFQVSPDEVGGALGGVELNVAVHKQRVARRRPPVPAGRIIGKDHDVVRKKNGLGGSGDGSGFDRA